MKLNFRNNSFLSQFAWYFSGALVPLMINFIKTPIFTRHYSPEDFGVLGLVMISFGYLATLSYSWIKSCLWRFYPKYKKANNLASLYSHLLFIFGISSLLMIALAIIAMQFFESDTLAHHLLWITAIHFVLHEFLNLYFVVIRLEGKAKLFNVFTSVQVGLSFILLLLLAFVADFNISSMLWSYIFIDVLFIIFLIFRNTSDQINSMNFRQINKNELNRLLNFGGVSLLASLFLMLIVSSDRYIIALYEPIKQVGIYGKTYDVAQMSILALVFIFFNTVNPSMNHMLEENVDKAKHVLFKYIYAFTFLLLPVVTIASIFRREITDILLGEEFQSGYVLMPYIFCSMLIFGIINFYENEFKFSKRLKRMTLFFAVGFALNLLLNFLLIPLYGMIWAAISTLITYVFILILFLTNDKQIIKMQELNYIPFLRLIVVLLIMVFIDFFIRNTFQINLFYGIIEAFLFVGIIIILFWKDVKNLEIPMLN